MRKGLVVVSLVLVGLLAASYAFAATLGSALFEFDPTKTNHVAAAWVKGLGEADASGPNNFAVLVSKSIETAANASSGVVITGAVGIVLNEPTSVLGFDIRDGSHCGAGAPRFNVVTMDGVLHFLGCQAAASTVTAVDGEPAIEPGWTRKKLTPSDLNQAFPAIPTSAISSTNTVSSIAIVFDEGTDQGVGFAILDNININGVFLGRPGGQ